MSNTDSAVATDLYQITAADLDRLPQLGQRLVPNLQHYIDLFYEWLPSQPEFHQLFSSDDTVERVKGLQIDYWAPSWKRPWLSGPSS